MTQKKISIIITFVILSILSSYSQNLTKQEMLNDVTYLDSILKTSYSQYEIREKYTGLDISEYINGVRDKIEKEKISDDNFVYLIRSILTYTQDKHNRITIPNWVSEYDSTIVKNILVNDTIKKQSSKRYNEYFTYINKNLKYNPSELFPIRYIDGKYYNSLTFKQNGVKFKHGMQIVKFNGKNIEDVVNQNLDNLSCHWDSKYNKYYSEAFIIAHREVLNKDSISLTLKESEGSLKSVTLSNNCKLKILNKPWIFIQKNKTTFFKKSGTLYVRLLSQSLKTCEKEIFKQIPKYKNKEINKVIIDIRGNCGGSDLVWIKILNLIIDKPLNPVINVGVKDINKGKLFYSDVIDTTSINKFPHTNTDFCKLDYEADVKKYIKPDSNSINYKGKIYIIQDKEIFSSATAFSSLAQYSDKFIVVGEPNGQNAGMGEEPLLFLLPNSKILFQVVSSLDKTQVKTPSDYFNKVDIEIIYDINDWFLRDSKNWNLYSKNFLRKKDIMFKTVMKLN